MNLVQMRHPGLLKAYVHYSNAQMKDTPKMDEFCKKCIILGGVSKACGEYQIQICKVYWGCGGDHQNFHEN